MARACDRVLHTGGVLTRLVRDAAAEAASAADRCRYPGLATFEVADAACFFGRARVTAALVSRPAVTLQEGGLPAPTSPLLLRADLVAAGSRHWPVQVFTPGQRPLEALSTALQHGDHTLDALLRGRPRLPSQPTAPDAPRMCTTRRQQDTARF